MNMQKENDLGIIEVAIGSCAASGLIPNASRPVMGNGLATIPLQLFCCVIQEEVDQDSIDPEAGCIVGTLLSDVLLCGKIRLDFGWSGSVSWALN